jgi:phosphoribosylamine--glycine ligase
MRILGVGDDLCLGPLYLRLSGEGHDVRVSGTSADSAGILDGLIERSDDWSAQLPWIRAAGEEGLIIFETANHGAVQDALRAEGFRVIGGSRWGDRLEEDRDYGQLLLQQLGLQTVATHRFVDHTTAIEFVRRQPGRYVYKICSGHTASTRNYVGQLDSGEDLIAMLGIEGRRVGDVPPAFVLMEYVDGVEIGTGAYFDGHRFLQPACIDWEHKRFFPGNLGELTGEMGTVVSFRRSRIMFERVLAPLESSLERSGYVGWLNVNTIVNAHGIWPLEFTCRFGYPGTAICGTLQTDAWGSVLRKMVDGRGEAIRTRDGYAVGIVLTTPPFPYDEPRCAPVPIFFRDALAPTDWEHIHLAEVARDQGQLMVSGSRGYPLVVTGVDDDLREAQRKVNALAARVVIPNLRYRTDIGEALIRQDMRRLEAWGVLGDDDGPAL